MTTPRTSLEKDREDPLGQIVGCTPPELDEACMLNILWHIKTSYSSVRPFSPLVFLEPEVRGQHPGLDDHDMSEHETEMVDMAGIIHDTTKSYKFCAYISAKLT